MNNEKNKPTVSIIIVADYASGGSKAWEEIKETVRAVDRQECDEPKEILLLESEQMRDHIPPDVRTLTPSLRIVTAPVSTSYELKNTGVSAAAGDIVVLLDADCVPDPGWLSSLIQTMKNHPEISAVSGRTCYPGKAFPEGMLALLVRSYLDPGHEGRTNYVSNNNAAYRREVYLRHPLPTQAGPFASRMQEKAIARAGGKFYFEPKMRVVHEFEGWGMERDIRHNMGYATIVTRMQDPSLPYAGFLRLSYASIPVFLFGKYLEAVYNCVRCYLFYNVRWYQLPVAFILAGIVLAMEIPGMLTAFNGQHITETAYR